MSPRKVSHLSDLSSLQSKLRGKKVVDETAVLATICHELFYGLLRIRDGVFAPCPKEGRKDAHRGSVQGVAANRPPPAWSRVRWVESRADPGADRRSVAGPETRHEQPQRRASRLRMSDFKGPGAWSLSERPNRHSRIATRESTVKPEFLSIQIGDALAGNRVRWDRWARLRDGPSLPPTAPVVPVPGPPSVRTEVGIGCPGPEEGCPVGGLAEVLRDRVAGFRQPLKGVSDAVAASAVTSASPNWR